MTELCLTKQAVVVPLAYVVEVKLVEREPEEKMIDALKDTQLIEILTVHGSSHTVDVKTQQFLNNVPDDKKFTVFLEKWVKSISSK